MGLAAPGAAVGTTVERHALAVARACARRSPRLHWPCPRQRCRSCSADRNWAPADRAPLAWAARRGFPRARATARGAAVGRGDDPHRSHQRQHRLPRASVRRSPKCELTQSAMNWLGMTSQAPEVRVERSQFVGLQPAVESARAKIAAQSGAIAPHAASSGDGRRHQQVRNHPDTDFPDCPALARASHNIMGARRRSPAARSDSQRSSLTCVLPLSPRRIRPGAEGFGSCSAAAQARKFFELEINRLDIKESRKCKKTPKNCGFFARCGGGQLRIAVKSVFFPPPKQNGPTEQSDGPFRSGTEAPTKARRRSWSGAKTCATRCSCGARRGRLRAPFPAAPSSARRRPDPYCQRSRPIRRL